MWYDEFFFKKIAFRFAFDECEPTSLSNIQYGYILQNLLNEEEY